MLRICGCSRCAVATSAEWLGTWNNCRLDFADGVDGAGGNDVPFSWSMASVVSSALLFGTNSFACACISNHKCILCSAYKATIKFERFTLYIGDFEKRVKE